MLNNGGCIELVIVGVVRNDYVIWEDYLRVFSYGEEFVRWKGYYWERVGFGDW